MMFSFQAIMKDSTDGSEYRLEHPENGSWHLYHNGQELPLKGEPKMYSDGGTIEATFTSEGDDALKRQLAAEPVPDVLGEGWVRSSVFVPANKLNIPQQLFAKDEPQAPTINGRPLELIRWQLGGKRHLNGTALQD